MREARGSREGWRFVKRFERGVSASVPSIEICHHFRGSHATSEGVRQVSVNRERSPTTHAKDRTSTKGVEEGSSRAFGMSLPSSTVCDLGGSQPGTWLGLPATVIVHHLLLAASPTGAKAPHPSPSEWAKSLARSEHPVSWFKALGMKSRIVQSARAGSWERTFGRRERLGQSAPLTEPFVPRGPP